MEKRLEINNLIIELTRKCNMFCEHCLRGDAQPKDIKNKYITSLLEQTTYIDCLTLTGGEPTLAVEEMRFLIDEIKRLGVEISHFYMATNGKNVSGEFVLLLLELYLITNSSGEFDDMNSVALSNDYFHEEYDGGLLKGLSFFTKRNKEGKKFSRGNYLNEGRYADNWNDGVETLCERIVLDEYCSTEGELRVDGEVYLNVKGDIIEGCNWSYDNQEKYKLCRVEKFAEFMNEKDSGGEYGRD